MHIPILHRRKHPPPPSYCLYCNPKSKHANCEVINLGMYEHVYVHTLPNNDVFRIVDLHTSGLVVSTRVYIRMMYVRTWLRPFFCWAYMIQESFLYYLILGHVTCQTWQERSRYGVLGIFQVLWSLCMMSCNLSSHFWHLAVNCQGGGGSTLFRLH